MKALRLILSSLLAIAGVVVPFWLMHHGINYQDEPYQMLNALEWAETPVAPLSALAGWLWSKAFGFTLLAFRSFAVICTLLSVALAAAVLYRRTHRLDYTLAAFGAGALALAWVPSKCYLYGWDSLSILLVTAVMVAIAAYMRRPSWIRACGLGFLAALATLSRLPDAAVMLPALAAIIVSGNARKRLTVCIGTYAIVLIFCICAIYGTPGAYFTSLSENMISGHDLAYIMQGYQRTLSATLHFTLLAGGIVMFFRILSSLGAFVIACIVLLSGLVFPPYPLATVANFLSLGCLLAFSAYCTVSGKKQSNILVAVVLVTAFCATVGSDMGFEKVITVQAVILLIAEAPDRVRRSLMLAAATMFVIVLRVEVPRQRERTFEDKGYGYTATQVTVSPFRGVYTTKLKAFEAEYLQSVTDEWQKQGGEVVVLGDCFHYAVDLIAGHKRPDKLRHYYLIDNPGYFAEAAKLIPEATVGNVMVITSRPFDWRYSGIEATDHFPALRRYRATYTPCFTIYTPAGATPPQPPADEQ